MDNIIGYNLSPAKRLEYWHAMQIFREGSIKLKQNPDTNKIAIADQERYKRFLSHYVGDARSASLGTDLEACN